MNDALTAAAKLFTWIPLRVRQGAYGLFALVILVEPIIDVMSEEVDLKVIAGFGLFNTLMALANSSPSQPPTPSSSAVPEQFPGEFQ
jgi:hypothetical protein